MRSKFSQCNFASNIIVPHYEARLLEKSSIHGEKRIFRYHLGCAVVLKSYISMDGGNAVKVLSRVRLEERSPDLVIKQG